MTTAKQRGHTCVVGLAWGDEGKGKIVDLLCHDYDVVVRFNGGANAGHTVCIGDDKFALHLLPSGALHPEKKSVIGPGVVVDPWALIEEIDGLVARGIEVGPNLRLSDRAHLVMPWHLLEDKLNESEAAPSDRIGTTARGIGPCYADKMRRQTGIRACDLLNLEDLEPRVAEIVRQKCVVLSALFDGEVSLDADTIMSDLRRAADRLAPFIDDTVQLLLDAIDGGERILFEAANGTLLDIDHGTYPYVTSSGTTANSVAPGAGVPARTVSNILGVTKAYATRVGKGPFVTELKNETGDLIRERGHEYGTTTGRPRRCGWFDAVVTARSVRLSGVTEIALMHLDTLSGFDQVGICTAYHLDGQRISAPPADPKRWPNIEPVIEMLPGWSEDVSEIDTLENLPQNARRFIERVSELVGAPITIVSVGPRRSQTILGNTAATTPAATTAAG